MNNSKLLICIAFHYDEAHYAHLKTVLSNILNTYRMPLHVIIDTNSPMTRGRIDLDYPGVLHYGQVEICVHTALAHPFHLTSAHRVHFLHYLNDYAFFLYQEDDLLIPFENLVNYVKTFDVLPPNYTPAFMRVETKGGVLYNTDNPRICEVAEKDILNISGRRFVALANMYNGCWLLSQHNLENNLGSDFLMRTRLVAPPGYNNYREQSASHVIWQLRWPAVVELTADNKITKLAYIHHLPNNYVNTGGAYGSIKIDDVVRVK